MNIIGTLLLGLVFICILVYISIQVIRYIAIEIGKHSGNDEIVQELKKINERLERLEKKNASNV